MKQAAPNNDPLPIILGLALGMWVGLGLLGPEPWQDKLHGMLMCFAAPAALLAFLRRRKPRQEHEKGCPEE